jgi:hypothetical protein
MNTIILKGAALRQPQLPQSGPRAKTIAHPCFRPLVPKVVYMNPPRAHSDLQGVHVNERKHSELGCKLSMEERKIKAAFSEMQS